MGFIDVFVLTLSVIAYCGWIIYTQDLQWSTITVENIGLSHYPLISPLVLGVIRSICALVVWSTLYYLYTDKNGVELYVLMRDGSKRKILLRYGDN